MHGNCFGGGLQIALGADGPRLVDRDDGQAGNLPAGRAKHLGIIELEEGMFEREVAADEIGHGDHVLDAPLELTDGMQRLVGQGGNDLVAGRALDTQGYVLKRYSKARIADDKPNVLCARGQQHQEVGPFDPADAAAV